MKVLFVLLTAIGFSLFGIASTTHAQGYGCWTPANYSCPPSYYGGYGYPQRGSYGYGAHSGGYGYGGYGRSYGHGGDYRQHTSGGYDRSESRSGYSHGYSHDQGYSHQQHFQSRGGQGRGEYSYRRH